MNSVDKLNSVVNSVEILNPVDNLNPVVNLVKIQFYVDENEFRCKNKLEFYLMFVSLSS
mgnify:CR=1 FL=1